MASVWTVSPWWSFCPFVAGTKLSEPFFFTDTFGFSTASVAMAGFFFAAWLAELSANEVPASEATASASAARITTNDRLTLPITAVLGRAAQPAEVATR